MNRIRVQVLVKLRGAKDFWDAGTIFDSKKAPIPKDILAEVKSGRKTVMLLPDEVSITDEDLNDDKGRTDRSSNEGNKNTLLETRER